MVRAILVVSFLATMIIAVATEIRWRKEVDGRITNCTAKFMPEVDGMEVYKLDIATNWEEYFGTLIKLRRKRVSCIELEDLYCHQNWVYKLLTGRKLNGDCHTIFSYFLRTLIPF